MEGGISCEKNKTSFPYNSLIRVKSILQKDIQEFLFTDEHCQV